MIATPAAMARALNAIEAKTNQLAGRPDAPLRVYDPATLTIDRVADHILNLTMERAIALRLPEQAVTTVKPKRTPRASSTTANPRTAKAATTEQENAHA